MKQLAITGGIACGKSLCGRFFEDLGCPVCDTDGLGHALLARGQPTSETIIKCFGSRIIEQDGEIDRRELGRRVFRDRAAMETLNATLHPAILQRMHTWIDEQRQQAPPAVAVQIPLFFEIGAQRESWDAVICVAASANVCRRRLRQRGWSAGEISARNRAQWPLAEKIRLADMVLHNDGNPAWLQRQILAAWTKLI